MNEKILEDLELICTPEPKPTIRSRLATFYQSLFHNDQYHDLSSQKWELDSRLGGLVLNKLIKNC
jgi:DNA-directed RNA polymerase delta subunit